VAIFKKMKILFSIFLIIISLESCTNRKQRDIRKLSWFEIAADARNKEVTILVDEKNLEDWNIFYAPIKDTLALKFSISVVFKGMKLQQINDSLVNFTTTEIIECNGKDLEYALNEHLLFGPFDKLLPFSKKEIAKSDAFRFSEGIATNGFAVPIKALPKDSLPSTFFAIPIKTKNQAAAIVVLNAMLHAAEKTVLSPPNE
jgi:hypothetical protein